MIRKEFRALAPTWLAIAVAMVAAEYSLASLRGFGVAAYFIGAVALGAQAIGHEYNHRTLSMLLAQPVGRGRVLLVKLGVLAALLAALAGVAAITLPFLRTHQVYGAAVMALPVLLGFFVAPWLTMAARSPLAGTVFPVAFVGLTLVAGNLLGIRLHGYAREGDAFRVAFMWWTMGGLCATGAVMTCWTFLRLQITDGSGEGLEINPRTAARFSTGSLTRRNPVWLLLMKELHLQQLALGVAVVYVAGYLLILAFRSASGTAGDSLTAGTLFYAGVLAMLIGALASAEERQLGTHEWQQLLPMAAWQQWAVKVGTAIGLALLLGIGLPLLLVSVLPPEPVAWPRRIQPFRQPVALVLLTIVTTGGLYVSSVSRSGLWALTLSIPVMFGVAMFFASVAGPIERAVHAGALSRLSGVRLSLPALAGNAVFLAVLVALLGMVLRFALANHRSSERSVSRIAQQVVWMAGWAVVGLAAVAVLGTI